VSDAAGTFEEGLDNRTIFSGFCSNERTHAAPMTFWEDPES